MSVLTAVEQKIEASQSTQEARPIIAGVFPQGFLQFLALVIASITAIYYMAPVFKDIWLLLLLFLYYRSTKEAMWLAVFLVMSDGFLGFFGLYEASLAILPGLPAIEAGQLYVLLSVIKAARLDKPYPLFFRNILALLGAYLIFLILIGFLFGLAGGLNVYFRVFKMTLPFLLFFSLPRLLRTEADFVLLFGFIFPVAVLGLVAQLTDITSGQSLTSILGARAFETIEITEDRIYRGFYNSSIVILSFFGVLFFLARKKHFATPYLSVLLICLYSMIFLSATRGWIIGFGMTTFLYVVVVLKSDVKNIITIGFAVTLLVLAGLSQPMIRTQLEGSLNRLFTLENLAEGDLTADGTLGRITERSPRVMNQWKKSPVLGWGFSSGFFEYNDEHVGNQNLLMHSGVVGLLLVILFLGLFVIRLASLALHTGDKVYYVFGMFLMGWFLIHSTSGQHFAFYSLPGSAISQAFFFCFGAFIYHQAVEKLQGKTA